MFAGAVHVNCETLGDFAPQRSDSPHPTFLPTLFSKLVLFFSDLASLPKTFFDAFPLLYGRVILMT